jgi:uncharacterized protein YozE (UPF0346 family)
MWLKDNKNLRVCSIEAPSVPTHSRRTRLGRRRVPGSAIWKHLEAMGLAVILLAAACAPATTPSPTALSTSAPTTVAPTIEGSSPTPTPAGPTADRVQAYANPITESMLAALNNNDYAAFSKDLGQTAKNTITSSVFSQLYDQINATIGSYESVLFFGFAVQEPNTTVSYIAHYTNEPAGVSVTVVFQTVNSTHLVAGFTLDSPKLRGQSINVTQIRSYADPATENVLMSLNNDDYASFSKDFNQQMKSTINQTSFDQIYNMMKTKVGNYGSMEFESVAVQNNVTIVKYLAQYTDEPSGVWVTISFDSNQKVAGLYFNSPKITEQ